MHHRRNAYNAARSGYLAALRADPGYSDARYNLAVLCWHRGVAPEARHHAEKFRTAYPDDPRGAKLETLMAAAAGSAAAPAGAQPPSPAPG